MQGQYLPGGPEDRGPTHTAPPHSPPRAEFRPRVWGPLQRCESEPNAVTVLQVYLAPARLLYLIALLERPGRCLVNDSPLAFLGHTEVIALAPAPCPGPGLAFVCSAADHRLLGAHCGPEKGRAADHPWTGSPGGCQGQTRGQQAHVRRQGHRSWVQAGTMRPQERATWQGLRGLEGMGATAPPGT